MTNPIWNFIRNMIISQSIKVFYRVKLLYVFLLSIVIVVVCSLIFSSLYLPLSLYLSLLSHLLLLRANYCTSKRELSGTNAPYKVLHYTAGMTR